MKFGAGMLRERVDILGLERTSEGWAWATQARVWAGAELTGKSCLFSKLGIGARAVELTLRRRALTLHQAVRWRGLHLFLTEITEPERGWLRVAAAVVELSRCREIDPATGTPGPESPGAMTLKYQKHAQETPMSLLTTGYVLVTPKAVVLTPGRLVEICKPGDEGYETFEVRGAYALDPYKNEYEVVRERDL